MRRILENFRPYKVTVRMAYLMLFTVLFLSVGYSAFVSDLSIAGVVTEVRLQKDVRIDSVSVDTSYTPPCTWTDSDSSDTVNVSDIVTCGTESFYVIESTGSNISMLSMYNINPTEQNPRQNSSAVYDYFSETAYWIDGNTFKAGYTVTSTDSTLGDIVYAYDSNSRLYRYLTSYQTYLKSIGVNAKASLMSYEKYLELDSDGIDFIYDEDYWLGSGINNPYDVIVGIDLSDHHGTGRHGVRPVIEVPLSNIVLNANGASRNTEYDVENILSTVTLPDSDSVVKYNIDIMNLGNVEVGILKIDNLPNNLDYEFVDYNEKEKICDSNNECKLGIIKQIGLIIKYKDGYYSSNTTFDINIHLDFRQLYNVTYTGINGSYPSEVIEGDTLDVDFGGSAPEYVQITMNDIELTQDTDYTYTNGVLSIPNVDGDIDIVATIKEEIITDYTETLPITADSTVTSTTNLNLSSRDYVLKTFKYVNNSGRTISSIRLEIVYSKSNAGNISNQYIVGRLTYDGNSYVGSQTVVPKRKVTNASLLIAEFNNLSISGEGEVSFVIDSANSNISTADITIVSQKIIATYANE